MELNCTLFKYSGSKTFSNARMNCKTKFVSNVSIIELFTLSAIISSKQRSQFSELSFTKGAVLTVFSLQH